MASNKIFARHINGVHFETAWDGHPLHIDLPAGKGGSGLGPSPKALMLVSLAGCTGLDVVMILDKMRVKYTGLTIEVEGEQTETDPRTYHTVTITYSINLEEKDRPNMEKAVKLSQEKYCGVSAMFRSFSKLQTIINYVPLIKSG